LPSLILKFGKGAGLWIHGLEFALLLGLTDYYRRL